MSQQQADEATASSCPVARVAVDVSLAHLDRPFDYLVPASLDGDAVPGCRVRVRFAGKLVGGFLLERVPASEHPGRLARLHRVVSAEPVLAPQVLRLSRAVADRYAGTLADVLRLAVPPRHARVEREPAGAEQAGVQPAVASQEAATSLPGAAEDGPWAGYPDGPALLRALADGRSPRAVWAALPGQQWPEAVAEAVRATLASGRGALVLVADNRDVARVDAALVDALGPGRHVALTAEVGPAERYRRWLALRRGRVRAVVGTRAAMFAPVADLGLALIWDDGDDVHAEPHAPYPHAREVLALRSYLDDAAFVAGGFAMTAEGAQLVASGWARPVAAAREAVRAAAPRVQVAGQDSDVGRDSAARTARLPTSAWRAAKDALAHGPVLVQVPRRGYLPAVACQNCRAPARCPACHGPLALPATGGSPSCRWCGQTATSWRCPECGAATLRAQVVGAGRTAEELGRAFPGVPVRTSGRGEVIAEVDERPALVVATPGAEPVAAGGYAAAVLLDPWALLGRPDLRAAEETLRRWAAAAALVRPGTDGGVVVLAADPALGPVQALVRWDPAGFAERELAERAELGFPPAVRMASLTGPAEAVADLVDGAALPPAAEVLGPVEVAGTGRSPDPATTGIVRALVRVPTGVGRELTTALQAAQARRSAGKAAHHVRLQIDPLEIV